MGSSSSSAAVLLCLKKIIALVPASSAGNHAKYYSEVPRIFNLLAVTYNNKVESIILEDIVNLQGCVRHGTGIFGTGMDVVPNLPKCPVPVLTSYQTYRSVRYRYDSLYRYRRYRYPYRTELTEVFGSGINVVPNLPMRPVRV